MTPTKTQDSLSRGAAMLELSIVIGVLIFILLAGTELAWNLRANYVIRNLATQLNLNLLRECEDIEVIESLQVHGNTDIQACVQYQATSIMLTANQLNILPSVQTNLNVVGVVWRSKPPGYTSATPYSCTVRAEAQGNPVANNLPTVPYMRNNGYSKLTNGRSNTLQNLCINSQFWVGFVEVYYLYEPIVPLLKWISESISVVPPSVLASLNKPSGAVLYAATVL